MKREEFLLQVQKLEQEIKELTKQYINENAPFKVGEVIITEDGIIGKITKFTHRGEGIIACNILKRLKNGEFTKNETHLSNYKLYNSKLYDNKC